jgi:uncharacterized protein YbbC (DUF1343 family)
MVEPGLQRLLRDDTAMRRLHGRRVGLLCNPTSVSPDLHHAVDLLRDRVELSCLFGPEHGVRGEAQDMIAVDTGVDRMSGLRVHSLYGDDESSLRPTDAMLGDIDILVCDLQDIGTRYYTYAWTIILAMQACAKKGIPVVVCDRPNPLGGEEIEGPSIRAGFESFVGLYPIANRHGLTLGELCRHINQAHSLGCDLQVVPMTGWRRSMHYEDGGLPWVLPSPNMPTPDTAFVYPGLCLIEGTELSEGRGTTRPFEIVGAPYIDGPRLQAELDRCDLPGARFRPLTFRPTFHKFAGAVCGGIQIHVADRRSFRPYRTGVAILHCVRRLWPTEFAWRRRRYEFVSDKPAIDLLAGGPILREQIDGGADLREIVASWREDEEAFRAASQRVRLYD